MIHHRFYHFLAFVALSLLVSCGDISPTSNISGSSSFRFIDYFIYPLTDSVVAIEDSNPTNSNQNLSFQGSAAPSSVTGQAEDPVFSSYSDFLSKTVGDPDTSKGFFDKEYCEHYARGFKNRIPAKFLYETPSTEISENAPLVAEKAYLEAMRNYCYALEIFNADDTRPNETNDADYGELRWYNNPNSSPDDSNSEYNYLVSQSKQDDKVRILSMFKQLGGDEDKLYGRLDLIQEPSGQRRFKLIRYFVDDDTKGNKMPDSFRWEGYAIVTTTADDGHEVHHIASYIADYVTKSLDDRITPNQLTIHSNQFVVHENAGSKMVKATYCTYAAGADDDPVSFDVYKAGCFDNNSAKDKYNTIDNSTKSGNEMEKGYYKTSGVLMTRTGGITDETQEYSRTDLKEIDTIDSVVKDTILKNLSDNIKPPTDEQVNPDSLFNPSATDQHKDFKDPCQDGSVCRSQ